MVGADRITADGSVANKIGTYSLAVAAQRHGIPFIVVAPESTRDLATATGREIVVEQRARPKSPMSVGLPLPRTELPSSIPLSTSPRPN